MSAKDIVIEQALKLTETERLEIAERLYDSIAGPPDPNAERAWAEEVALRLREVDAGRAKLIPWEQARQQIGSNGVDDAPSSG